MQKNIKIRIEESGGCCDLLDLNSGNRLERIRVKEDLDKALSYLKKINQLKNEEGQAVYKIRTIYDVSPWSFHQGWLFWENLRHFVFYEEVLKVLKEKKYTVFISGQEKLNLINILEHSNIPLERSMFLNIKIVLRRIKVSISEKILSFIALAFGYLSLVYFKLNKIRILVYSPDKFDIRTRSDFRMERIYKFFRNEKVPIVEVFHTLLGREFVRNLILRKRPSLYLESLPFKVSTSSINTLPFKPILSGFEKHQEDYIWNLINRMDMLSKTSILRVLTLRKVIGFMKIDKLVTIDDMRSAQEVVLACRSLGIGSYAFQHGHINEYHTGHMNYGIPKEMSVPFDKLFTWNDYWKQKLVAHSSMYDIQNVQVGGYLRPPKESETRSKTLPEKPEELSILIANDTWAPREEVRQYLEKLLNMGCSLYLSIRPDLPIEKQTNDFGISNHPRVNTSRGSEALLQGKVDCVAGVYSTFIYEMLYYDIPAFVFKTSFSFGKDLVEDGLVYQLNPNFDFEEIKNYLVASKSKRNILWPTLDISIEDTLKRILK